MVADKYPNGLNGPIGLNPTGPNGLIGLNPTGPNGLIGLNPNGLIAPNGPIDPIVPSNPSNTPPTPCYCVTLLLRPTTKKVYHHNP